MPNSETPSIKETFKLRWKGIISEPLLKDEIFRKLQSGEISLIHNVEIEDGKWISIRDFFEKELEEKKEENFSKLQEPVISKIDSNSENIIHRTVKPNRFKHPLKGKRPRQIQSSTPSQKRRSEIEINSEEFNQIFYEDNAPKQSINVDKTIMLGYLYCGLSFILPGIALIPAMWKQQSLRKLKEDNIAQIQFVLCCGFTTLGFIFWGMLLFLILQ